MSGAGAAAAARDASSQASLPRAVVTHAAGAATRGAKSPQAQHDEQLLQTPDGSAYGNAYLRLLQNHGLERAFSYRGDEVGSSSGWGAALRSGVSLPIADVFVREWTSADLVYACTRQRRFTRAAGFSASAAAPPPGLRPPPALRPPAPAYARIASPSTTR